MEISMSVDGYVVGPDVSPESLRKDGDVKLTGVAHPTTGPRDEARYYRLDLREVATVGVGRTGLAITVWTPERGVRSWTR